MKITSVNNDLIKETAKLLRSKYRDESGLFLVEGMKGIEEAIDAKLEIVHLFVQQNLPPHLNPLPLGEEIICEVTEPILAKISDAKTPPKAVAVVKQPKYKWSEKFKKVVLLEGIKDPGNLGTILRSASAFGIDALVLYGDTVDLYNPKCVRSTVGNLWKIPVFKMSDLSIFANYERIATLPKGVNGVTVIPLKSYKPTEKILVMFGSEADGLSEELKNFATKNITIEMGANVESLNLSVSASIIMYELFNK